jgi:plastocyanin
MTFGAILTLGLAAACGGGTPATTATPAGATGTPGAATATPAEPTQAAAVVCDATGEGTAVTIENFSYKPSSASVATNGFVTFTNNDSRAHTVTFDEGPNCGNLGTGGDSVTIQFTAAGSYGYHCNIHPEMVGTVEVS